MHHFHNLYLTHWGRVTHICVVKLTIIGSDNGLSPGRRQAIIWTNAGMLLIMLLGTNFIEILIGIQTFSFKKMHLKMSSANWRPFSLGLNVLTEVDYWSCGYLGLLSYCVLSKPICRQVSNIRRILEGNKIVDHSDVVGASPVGAAPNTSSFST